MSTDRLLGTLLRSLQIYTDQQDTPRLLGTASRLLITLNNPLNVTLLASHVLSAPAIWDHPEGLRTSTQTLSVFHSAAQALVRHEKALQERTSHHNFTKGQLERALSKDEWILAMVNAADDQSPRWRHVLLIGGLLLGFGPVEDENLSGSMRTRLESGFVAAVNAALHEVHGNDLLGQETICLVLNHCFASLPDHERVRLDYNLVLPVLLRATLHGRDGLRSAFFLSAVDVDVQPISETQFQWSENSVSYQQIQKFLSSPLISSLGPLARLAGHAIEQARDSGLVIAALDDIEGFSRTLYLQWRQSKLSEIDASEENIYLDGLSLNKTIPSLWKLLRSTLYAVIIIMRSIIGRILGDGALTTNEVAPRLSTQALHILRYLYFIYTRFGLSTLSQYTFVNLAALDVLAAYPPQAEAFLQVIKPVELGQIPRHPQDRCLDLFFLNTAEHLTLAITPEITEELVMAAAAPYLVAGGNVNLMPIFEAAHSVTLSAFSAPRNSALTAKYLPFYVDALFKVFPNNLSARQFRMAFKTLLRITSPPSPLSFSQPLLSATLLDLLYERAAHASTVPLFPQPASKDPDASPEAVIELSEQAVLTFTLLDTLSQIDLDLLEEWLPLAADMINQIDDSSMRDAARDHFWHMLVGGDMDPQRSQLCAAWWGTGGGKEMVLFGREMKEDHNTTVSQARPGGSESKL